MLHTISTCLREYLKAKACPLRVIYGPERRDVALTDPRIVIERDRDRGDTFSGPRGNRHHRVSETQAIGAVLRVFAKSALPGAAVHDHERQADQAAGLVVVGLREIICSAPPGLTAWQGKVGPTLWTITGAGLLSAQEHAQRDLQTWTGVVYEITFAVDRGVVGDVNWIGETPAEAAIGGEGGIEIKSGTLSVTGSGGATATSDDLPEAKTEITNG